MVTTGLLKKKNMLDIVKVIRNNGPITKPDIAKFTGFASATVHNFVNELLEKSVIHEEGNADSSGGRKASLYKLNAKAYYVLGLNIGVKNMTASIFDLNLNAIEKIQKKFELAEYSVEEGINATFEVINDLLKKVDIDKRSIIGIGISVPGLVNFEKGLVLRLTNVPKWNNIPLKEILENEFGINTIIENDSNASVMCLKWMDTTREDKNVVYLSTTEGIGTGLLINGEVYRGNHNMAGEIGHLSIDPNGSKCNCGNRGCIEMVTSDIGLINIARKELQKAKESLLYQLYSCSLESLDIEAVICAANKQDAFARKILLNASQNLSTCISNITKMYDPDEIIIDSTWLKDFNDIFNNIRDYVYESIEFINRDNVKIILNPVKDIFVIGAATLVMELQFNLHEQSKLLI